MNPIASRGATAAVVVSLATIAGCASAPPAVHSYELRVVLQESGAHLPARLRIEPFNGTGSAARRELARRVSEHEIEFLDYHRYLDRPADLVTVSLEDAIGSSESDPANATGQDRSLFLGGTVTAFEVDWRDAGQPRARVAIEARLGNDVVHVPLSIEDAEPLAIDASPEQSVAALEVVLGRVLARIVTAAGKAATEPALAPAPRVAEESRPPPTRAAVEFDLAIDVAAAADPAPGRTLLVRRALAAPPFDRRDVVVRDSASRLTDASGLRFARSPAEIVTDALLDCLLATRPEGRGIARFDAAVPADPADVVEIATTLRRFEVDASGAAPAAVVSIEVTAGTKTVVAVGSFEAPPLALDAAGATVDTRALAGAFSAAASRAVDIAVRGIAVAERTLESRAPADEPEPARLSIVAEPPAVLAGPVAGSARLVAVSAPVEIDVPDVLVRSASGRVSQREDAVWAAPPSVVVTDQLLAALRSARVFEGGVVGPRGPGVHDHELHAELRAFEIEERQDGAVARVAIEIEAVRRAAAVSQVLLAQGAAEARLADATPDAVAAAMGRALGQATATAVRQLKDRIREATPDSSK